MASDRLYSQFIGWLKVVLPLGALAILSSVFYFARGSEDAREIPFIPSEREGFETERIEGPEYMSVTGDGATVRFTAREVLPIEGAADVYDADELAGRFETDAGRIIQLTAPTGKLNLDDQTANLGGIVSIETSDGFSVLTDAVHARLDATLVETGGPVRGEAPFGRLEAGRLRFSEQPGGTDLLRFTAGVKVIYEPRD